VESKLHLLVEVMVQNRVVVLSVGVEVASVTFAVG
jgi:hypothetical protein